MDPVVKKETGYIAAGTAVISALVQLAWYFLFDYDISVFLGGLWGGAFAVVNFMMMGNTVQKAVADGDELMARRRIRSSYQLRMAAMVVMVVLAYIIPFLNWVMAAASLLFPRITILFEPLFRKDLREKGGKE